MSSDSEDDCYGNIAQKLQSMKNNYREDKIDTSNLLIANLKEKTDNTWRKNDSLVSENCSDLSQNSETAEEITLDSIIAKNSKKRATCSKVRRAIDSDNILPNKRKRTKKSDASTSQVDTNQPGANVGDTTINNINNNDTEVPNTSNVSEEISRGGRRGRATGRARQTTPRRARGRRQASIPELFTNPNESGLSRGRIRARRGRRSLGADMSNPLLYDVMAALAASMAMAAGYSSSESPIYSVGNTDEYPDQCDDQQLFNASSKKPDVIVVEENETELDENEELSVKVYWQSAEHVKFNIRRFQKLTQIFNHFAERENVSHDKLFFTYNDKILKSDDTPDSINYSIVKFIDGGIINQSVSSILKKGHKEDGIKLKFQCQNVKKPFVTNIRPDEKMLVAMMKCSEHLEKPLDKLKFQFDGDLISGKSTPRELGLEEDECIDVRIVS